MAAEISSFVFRSGVVTPPNFLSQKIIILWEFYTLYIVTFAKFYNLKNCLVVEVLHIYYKNEQKMQRSNKNKIKNICNHHPRDEV